MEYSVKDPSKFLKELCSRFRSPYEIKVLDLEQVLYRNLKNGFELAVSGLNNSDRFVGATVCVWRIEGGTKLMEQVLDIGTEVQLKEILEQLAVKYNPALQEPSFAE